MGAAVLVPLAIPLTEDTVGGGTATVVKVRLAAVTGVLAALAIVASTATVHAVLLGNVALGVRLNAVLVLPAVTAAMVMARAPPQFKVTLAVVTVDEMTASVNVTRKMASVAIPVVVPAVTMGVPVVVARDASVIAVGSGVGSDVGAGVGSGVGSGVDAGEPPDTTGTAQTPDVH